MLRKLRFFTMGLIPGLLLVAIILNQKGASCSGYLPNSRVTSETLTKTFRYTPEFSRGLSQLNINEKFLKDSIVAAGEINFDKSAPRRQPCPEYVLTYPRKTPRYEVVFEKCKDSALFKSIRPVR